MDLELLNLRWDLTEDFSRSRPRDYQDVERPLPLGRSFGPWNRREPLPDVTRIRQEWRQADDRRDAARDHYDNRVKSFKKNIPESALKYLVSFIGIPATAVLIIRSFFPTALPLGETIFVLIVMIVAALVYRHSRATSIHSQIVDAWRRSLDVEWACIEANIRRLVLAAMDERRLYTGSSPQELGRSRPEAYLPRSELIESVYHDLRNPLSEPRKRAWIISYMQVHMRGSLDVAQEDPQSLEAMLKLLWEADHVALLAARELPQTQELPAPKKPPSPADIAREHIENARALEELFAEYAAGAIRVIDDHAQRMKSAGEDDRAIELYLRRARAQHEDRQRDLMREVSAEIARRRETLSRRKESQRP